MGFLVFYVFWLVLTSTSWELYFFGFHKLVLFQLRTMALLCVPQYALKVLPEGSNKTTSSMKNRWNPVAPVPDPLQALSGGWGQPCQSPTRIGKRSDLLPAMRTKLLLRLYRDCTAYTIHMVVEHSQDWSEDSFYIYGAILQPSPNRLYCPYCCCADKFNEKKLKYKIISDLRKRFV